jgi:hypothetical protein
MSKKLTSKGWSLMSPKTSERKIMKKECGSKCFLGPTNESCFPICVKGTCKINTKGIYAAYVRARQYGSKTIKRKTSAIKPQKNQHHRHTKKMYQTIASRAKKMLKKRGFGPNLN